MARRVDNHFLVRGQGNYAALGAIDWVSGTAVGSDLADDLKAEWSKHNMDDKVAKGAGNAGEIAGSVGNKLNSIGRKKKNGKAY
jgi:hypothetical protein